MRVSLEPATAEDFERLVGGRPAARARAIAAKLGDELLGIGGFLYMPDGAVWASMLVQPAGRKYPAAIFRAGVLAMRVARRLGLREVLASADPNESAAGRFLERLGFRFFGVINDERVYRWTA